MPQADVTALLGELVNSRKRVDMLVKSITEENAQLREQVDEAARQISRGATLAAVLVDAMLEVREELSDSARAALEEYEALHGPGVREFHRMRRLMSEAKDG
jgi:DNA gyrase/topoisomerase IV subunit A